MQWKKGYLFLSGNRIHFDISCHCPGSLCTGLYGKPRRHHSRAVLWQSRKSSVSCKLGLKNRISFCIVHLIQSCFLHHGLAVPRFSLSERSVAYLFEEIASPANLDNFYSQHTFCIYGFAALRIFLGESDVSQWRHNRYFLRLDLSIFLLIFFFFAILGHLRLRSRTQQ